MAEFVELEDIAVKEVTHISQWINSEGGLCLRVNMSKVDADSILEQLVKAFGRDELVDKLNEDFE